MAAENPRGLMPGQQLFDRYVARQFVRRGERSELWIAEDRQAGQWVQLVVWPQALKAERAGYGRLKIGLTRAMQLDHPNAVRVVDLLDDGRFMVLVMEAPEGRTWEQMLRERRPRPFDASELKDALAPLAAVLEHAWSRVGLVHGCIRPSQIIIGQDGSPKIQGFGLAPSIGSGGESIAWQEGLAQLLVYLSPRQLRGEEPGPGDDVYGLGMCLYRMIVGLPPYVVRGVAEALRQPDPPPPSDQRLALGIEGAPIPAEWERVLLDCLARDESRRPATVGEAVRRLLGQPGSAMGRPAAAAPVFATARPASEAPPVAASPLFSAATRASPAATVPPAAAVAATAAFGLSGRPSGPGVGAEGAGLQRLPSRLMPPPAQEPAAPPTGASSFMVPRQPAPEQPAPRPLSMIAATQPAETGIGLRPPLGATGDVPRPRFTPPPARDPVAEARIEEERSRRRRHKGSSGFAVALLVLASLVCLAGFTVRLVGVDRVRSMLGPLGASPAREAAPAAAGKGTTHLAAGEGMFNEAKFEAALSEFSLALQQGEDKAEAMYWRGRCFLALKKFESAVTEFTSALAANPGHAKSHLFRGYALVKAQRLGEALEDFNMAISADTTLIEAFHHRGSVLLELGQYDRALDDLNKVVKAKPGFAAYYDRGLVHFHMNAFAESLSDFDQAILLEPNFAPAHYNRGSVYFQTGRFRDAIRDFGEAIRINPRYENAYYMRGVASHRVGDHVRAIEDLSEAIRLRLDFREAWEQRGFVRLAGGDYHKANEDFEQARKLASSGQASGPVRAAGGVPASAQSPALPPSGGASGALGLQEPKAGEAAPRSPSPAP